MKHKRTTLGLLCLSLVALAHAGSFSAEMIVTKDGVSKTTPFHFADGTYRFEIAEKDRALVVVVDPAAGRTRIVAPAEKLYAETDSADRRTVVGNPFAACTFPFPSSTLRDEGAAAVDGIPCTRKVLLLGERELFVAWISDEFGFPLRIEDRMENRILELRGLQRGPQDPALFAAPGGYAKFERLPPPPPDWAAAANQAPLTTPPFEQTLNVGENLRVPIREGAKIKLVVTNTSPADATAVALPFKAGRPLVDPRGQTFTLPPEGKMTAGCTRTPAQADCYVIHVKAGSLTLNLAYEGDAPAP